MNSLLLGAILGAAIYHLIQRWDRSRNVPDVITCRAGGDIQAGDLVCYGAGVAIRSEDMPPSPWVVRYRDREQPSMATIPMLPDLAALSGVEYIRDAEGVAWWPRREAGEYQWTRIGG